MNFFARAFPLKYGQNFFNTVPVSGESEVALPEINIDFENGGMYLTERIAQKFTILIYEIGSMMMPK